MRKKTGKPVGVLRRIFAAMADPRTVVAGYVDDLGWPIALLIPTLAFGLLFLQTGLDLARSGASASAARLALSGAILGIVVVPLSALLAWVLLLPVERSRSLAWTVKAFAIAYSPALIYGMCGLLANVILGWNTAIAFGITGVLWAIAPLFAVLREMSGDRRRLSLFVATAIGALMLVVWAGAVGV